MFAGYYFFANNYCKFTTDNGIQQLTLRPYQEKILNNFKDHRFNIVLASRQSGKTLTSTILLLGFYYFILIKMY